LTVDEIWVYYEQTLDNMIPEKKNASHGPAQLKLVVSKINPNDRGGNFLELQGIGAQYGNRTFDKDRLLFYFFWI
jgi:hypothetical protein